jgi:transposase
MSHRTLTNKLVDVKPGTLYVGVDLGLDHNTAAVLPERGGPLASFRFPNEREGYDYFYRRLDALQERQHAPAVWVGMEPTNYFWKLLAADMEQHRPAYSYRLVNAFTVKKHREGDRLDRSKDDLRDASTIGDLLRTGKFTTTQLLQGGYAQLRECVTLYDCLGRDVRRQKTLVHNIAGQVYPEFGQVFQDYSGQTALAVLRSHAVAVDIRRMPLEALLVDVRGQLPGRRLLVSKLQRLHALARTSVGLKEGTQALQLSIRQHIEMLELLQRQRNQACAALTEAFLALPEAPYMLSVHGLGLLTAAVILSEIGDPSRYHQGQQLVKLAGLQPVPNTSGRKCRSRTPISRQGRPRLRTALFFAVLRLIQIDPAFADDYRQLQQRQKNPLLKMQALVVLMNKLLRILWTLMRQHTFYISGS